MSNFCQYLHYKTYIETMEQWYVLVAIHFKIYIVHKSCMYQNISGTHFYDSSLRQTYKCCYFFESEYMC